jgi:hypothetical protein
MIPGERELLEARRTIANEAACNSVGWRKLLLRRWADLSCITQSFHQLWNEHFPHHDALTLQLKQPVRSKAESYWEGESWKKAARDHVAGNKTRLP